MNEAKKPDPRLLAFVDEMIGGIAVGVDADGNESARPKSPTVRAHLEAVLLNVPGWINANYLSSKPELFAPLGAYLRDVADALDPAGASRKPSDVA